MSRTFVGRILVLSVFLSGTVLADDSNWPSFRGKDARGIAEGHALPAEWSLESGTNVRWRTEIPGLAHSSPVIWGDRIFVTTAVRQGGDSELKVGLYGSPAPVDDEGSHKFQVICLDKETGELIWLRTAIEAVPKMKRHPKGSHAASSPVTDGQHVIAFFASEGLYCYDVDGQLLWKRDFGALDSGWYAAKGAQFGFASSPILHEGKLILQVDVQEGSFLAALDVATGDDIWRTPRSDVPTWSTPTVDVANGRQQIVVNGYHHMGGYDLDTGAELWKLSGGGDVPVPTPIISDDIVFITNGHGRFNPIYAIDANARGEIEDGFDAEGEELVIWSQSRRGTYMQTPILYRGTLIACTDAGVVTSYDPKTGEVRARQRLGEGQTGFTASPVAGDGKLYFTSEAGAVHVLDAGELETLAVSELGEECMATPAISEGTIYFRARRHIVAISGDRKVEAIARTEPEPVAEEAVPAEPEPTELPADAPSAEKLFERHVAAIGGEKQIREHSKIHMKLTFEMASIGLKGTVERWSMAPDRLLTISDIPGVGEIRQGYDGEVGWMTGDMVGVQVLQGDLLGSVQSEADLFADLEYAERFESMKTVSRGDFQGFDCWGVEAVDGNGKKQTIYFEAETGLRRGTDAITATLGGPMRTINIFESYREVDGFRLVEKTKVLIPAQNMSQSSSLDELTFGGFDESVFELPKEIQEKVGDR
ncbi:MAG: PQQ-binding-like beta-propeller repeat protein [Planctomycetota bacterium]